MFLGQYLIRIDNRKRFRIPAVFMKTLKDEAIVIQKNLIVKGCLDIHPLSVFERKMEEFKSYLNPFNQQDELLLSAFYSTFFLVEPNKQTIYLPDSFYRFLNLNGASQLVLIGQGNFIRLTLKRENDTISREQFLEHLKKSRNKG